MKLTKKQVLADFRETVLPVIRDMYEQDGRIDTTARREEWNNYVDMLAQDGMITEKQMETWDNPY